MLNLERNRKESEYMRSISTPEDARIWSLTKTLRSVDLLTYSNGSFRNAHLDRFTSSLQNRLDELLNKKFESTAATQLSIQFSNL